MRLDPVARDVDTAGDPHALVLQHVVEQALETGRVTAAICFLLMAAALRAEGYAAEEAAAAATARLAEAAGIALAALAGGGFLAAAGAVLALRIAGMASAFKIPIHPHSSMTGVNQAASIHFLAAIGLATREEGAVTAAGRSS